jgi:ribosome maturation factor RimP
VKRNPKSARTAHSGRAADGSVRPPRPKPAAPVATGGADPRAAIEVTVTGLGYELVDVEREARGLLRVTIDRLPGRTYAQPGEAVTVDDCEQVTRQLQYALEVEGVDYARLEVSSPGLDRPLRREADFERFAGLQVTVVLKAPFEGRKSWKGALARREGGGWELHFDEGKGPQVLGFDVGEVREARLVPVVDFKGRRGEASPGDASNEKMEQR